MWGHFLRVRVLIIPFPTIIYPVPLLRQCKIWSGQQSGNPPGEETPFLIIAGHNCPESRLHFLFFFLPLLCAFLGPPSREYFDFKSHVLPPHTPEKKAFRHVGSKHNREVMSSQCFCKALKTFPPGPWSAHTTACLLLWCSAIYCRSITRGWRFIIWPGCHWMPTLSSLYTVTSPLNCALGLRWRDNSIMWSALQPTQQFPISASDVTLAYKSQGALGTHWLCMPMGIPEAALCLNGVSRRGFVLTQTPPITLQQTAFTVCIQKCARNYRTHKKKKKKEQSCVKREIVLVIQPDLHSHWLAPQHPLQGCFFVFGCVYTAMAQSLCGAEDS